MVRHNSLINYGGNWMKDLITLSSPINSTDSVIKCILNTTHQQWKFEISDIITCKINNITFFCKINSNTELSIIRRDKLQTEAIDVSTDVYILMHLVSSNAESLVTQFEFNRIKTKVEEETLDWVDLYYVIEEEISTSSFDLSLMLENDISDYYIEVEFYDVYDINGKLTLEKSDVEWNLSPFNKMFTWKSLTPISGSSLLIVFSYRKKSSDATKIRRAVNPENMIENVYDNTYVKLWMGPLDEMPSADEQIDGIIYIGL